MDANTDANGGQNDDGDSPTAPGNAGVTDPRTDSRAQLAYGLSVRAVRIVSASAE